MNAAALSIDTADPYAALCALERVCTSSPCVQEHNGSGFEQRTDTAKQALIFDTGGALWALPGQWVTEISRRPSLTRIPNASREIRGLINMRGTLVPVLDLGGLLGRVGVVTPEVVICLQQGRQLVGLSAHKVWGLRPMPSGLQRDVAMPALAGPEIWCGAWMLEQGLSAHVPNWPDLLKSAGMDAASG